MSFRAGLIARTAYATGPAITLSNSTVAESITVGANVGTLSVVGGTGTYTFSLTDTAGGKFTTAGTNGTLLNVAGALDYETATFHMLMVSATNGTDTIVQPVAITVTNVVEDTTPNAFSFTDVTGAALSTLVESPNSITVAGIDGPATMTITGGQYQINGGSWASTSTTVVVGNTVKVRGTSSASNSTAVNVVLTIGGVSDTFTITTLAGVGGVAPDAPVLSAASPASDTTPNFNIDLPSGNGPPNDAAAGDVLRVQSQLGVGSWTDYVVHTLTSGDITTDIINVTSVTPLANGSYTFQARLERGGANSAWSNSVVGVIGPATLSSPVGTKTGQSTATLSVSSDTASGTIYWVLTLSATPPTAAQVKLGQNNTGAAAAKAGNQAVSATGAQPTINVTGLTPSTTYFTYFMQENVGGQSAVAGATSFTTDAFSFTPAALTGLIGWYDAKVAASMKNSGGTTATNGQAVTTWVDQSGSGNDLTIFGAGPTLNTTGFNTSHPTLVFNSALNTDMQKAGYAIGTGNTLTAYVVVTMDTGIGTYARLLSYNDPTASSSFDNPGSAAILIRQAGNDAVGIFANSVQSTAAALAQNTPAIIGVHFTGSVFSTYMNNVRAGTGEAFNTAWDTGGTLMLCNDVSNSRWTGRVSELIICNADNTASATAIYNYLKAKWGL